MTVLTCTEVQYAMLCRMLERCLKMVQNSVTCFQELHLSFVRFDVSVLMWSAFALFRTNEWVLICYFQPLAGAILRVFLKL
jgi:hypothetical protein